MACYLLDPKSKYLLPKIFVGFCACWIRIVRMDVQIFNKNDNHEKFTRLRSLNAPRNKEGIYSEHVSIVSSRRLDKINIE